MSDKEKPPTTGKAIGGRWVGIAHVYFTGALIGKLSPIAVGLSRMPKAPHLVNGGADGAM